MVGLLNPDPPNRPNLISLKTGKAFSAEPVELMFECGGCSVGGQHVNQGQIKISQYIDVTRI